MGFKIPDWVKDHVPDAHVIEELQRIEREKKEAFKDRPQLPLPAPVVR